MLAFGTASPAAQADDWANLARYRETNRRLTASDPHRIVFMGDSITEGWGKEPFIQGNSHFVDRGISGQTAPQMLVRFRLDVVELKPAIVHIMAGTNDIAGNTGVETEDEMFGYIVSMVELARANHIKVILASVPPAADFWWKHGVDPAPKIRKLNARLKAYALSHAIVFADYWRVLARSDGAMNPRYADDGVHPNARGYEAMRRIAETAIARASRQR